MVECECQTLETVFEGNKPTVVRCQACKKVFGSYNTFFGKKLQDVELNLKFSVKYAFWESIGDIEHFMRYIYSKIAHDYNIQSKELIVKSSKHGQWTVDPENNNRGCNCKICNPKD